MGEKIDMFKVLQPPDPEKYPKKRVNNTRVSPIYTFVEVHKGYRYLLTRLSGDTG
jgi:hypothetical protein